ncbi:MAG: hypothetical protein DRP59_09835 [Spirochaetes bacterium]|nr:MAG: hypothetical protein DRP59_09835 [Spirochaetota bacterium]
MLMDNTLFDEFLPPLRRARGYFLYTADGRRFLDLYQDGGRALLGHRPDGLQRVIKSTAAKGLIAGYPSVYELRVEKALRMLFPGAVSFHVYRDNLEMYRALSSVFGMQMEAIKIADPLKGETGEITLWRPFLQTVKKRPPVVIPAIPFPEGMSPGIAAVFDKNLKPGKGGSPSPFALNSTVKIIYELVQVESAVSREHFSVFNSSLWDRKGIYLLFKMDKRKYRTFFIKSLEAGVLLPPESSIPGIIPLTFEPGHIKNFLRVVKEMQ